MARAFCLVALLAGIVAAPGCNCLGGSSCRRPSFMEFRSCLTPGCGASAPVSYAAPMAQPCGAAGCHDGCDACGAAAAAPCCDDGAAFR
jgi:hypothetical protein